MAKKDFKNPAMSFISQASIDAVDGKPESTTPTGNKPPEGYKLNPLYVETKSRRVQILVQPSVYADVRKTAEELGISPNDFINRALALATRNANVRDLLEKEI